MARPKRATAEIIELGGDVPTNGAEEIISFLEPFRVSVTLEGVSDLIFHRWNVEAVAEKAAASKGSKAKKTDDVESYVYRNDQGFISIPGTYVRGAIVNAAKFQQDPRSPRKSAMDLYKASIVNLTPLASMGIKRWDYEDKRRVLVQRQGINRTRPAFRAGWKATFELMCVLPEYISAQGLHETINMAGRIIGLADDRPTYGRFVVANYEVLAD